MSWEMIVIIPVGMLSLMYVALSFTEGCLTVLEKWQPDFRWNTESEGISLGQNCRSMMPSHDRACYESGDLNPHGRSVSVEVY